MKISLDWLREYVEIDLPLQSLIERLNMIGLLVDDYQERNGNIILDIETHANRPDTLGHLGIAREIAVDCGISLKEMDWPLATTDQRTSDLIDIQILDEDLCSRYCGIIVRDITVAPSPDWLKRKLEDMDLNPVNNVVDITNYVLYSTAHPIHAFDLEKIKGKKIIIRRARKGEVLRTLEGNDVQLSQEMLVIADEEEPIALAGVIGGEDSAVTEITRDVFIESAWFDPISVRKTSKKTGIQTDASYRFEREADIAFPPRAARMAASLLTQLGGKATAGVIDVYPRSQEKKTITLRHSRTSELIGAEVDAGFIQRTLKNMGFHLEYRRQGTWEVIVPSFRIDIEREIDLIEEIARFYGYEKIPSSLPALSIPEPPQLKKREKINKMRQLLFHQGFDEVVNFTFSDPQREAVCSSRNREIVIKNPISQKTSRLRTSLLGGLLENIVWNKNRGAEGIHIFEIGNIYFWTDKKTREELYLGMATTGLIGQKHWSGKSKKADFFNLKGTCESLMSYLRYEPFSFLEEDYEPFEDGYSLALCYNEKKIGVLGLLKEEILHSYSVEEAVCAAEINLSILFSVQAKPFLYRPVSKFPSISRDVSFLVEKKISYREIMQEIEKLSIPFLEMFNIYDRFSGSSIPEDKVSLSLRFVYRHPQRTLVAKEVDNLQQKIINHLKKIFKIQLREGGKIDKRT